MPKMIQLRHVPDRVHRKLKRRASEAGMSLSGYLVQEVTHLAEQPKQPTMKEFMALLRSRTPIEWAEPVAKTIRDLRDSR